MIYHITTERDWQIAREMGEYRAGSLKTEDFIHCSTREQIPKISRAFYQNVPNLVVLGIDTDRLIALVQWEAPTPRTIAETPLIDEGETFPHVYGAINLDAVVSVVPLSEFSQ